MLEKYFAFIMPIFKKPKSKGIISPNNEPIEVEGFETFLKVAEAFLHKICIRSDNKKYKVQGYDGLTISLAKLIEAEVQDAINMKNDNFLKTLEDEKCYISDAVKIDQDVLISSIKSIMAYFPEDLFPITISDNKISAQKFQIHQTPSTFSTLEIKDLPSIMLRKSKSSTSLCRSHKACETTSKVHRLVEILNNKLGKTVHVESSPKIELTTDQLSLPEVTGRKISRLFSSLSFTCANLTFGRKHAQKSPHMNNTSLEVKNNSPAFPVKERTLVYRSFCDDIAKQKNYKSAEEDLVQHYKIQLQHTCNFGFSMETKSVSNTIIFTL